MNELKKIPVIIDCDPGVDDAAALLLAFRSPALDIRGVTTVAGNVGLDKTTLNALKILDLIGGEVPVHRGADRPMFCEAIDAADIHGADGLHGIRLPDTSRAVSGEAAWDAIHREALAAGGALEIIAVGPLTNLGIALAKYGDLPSLLRRIVIMGGSASVGNTTAAAEFNILVDPEAADMVFRCGVPVHMCGLDVTHKSYLTAEEMDRIAALGSPQARFFGEVTRGSVKWAEKYGVPGGPMHDPCAVLYAIDDSIFTVQEVWARVELHGRITRGKTVTDLYSDAQREPNITIVTGVDRPAFVARVMELMARY